jgi:CRP/FNR family cyclic AMP-dependent transcriptional regulator
MFSFLSRRTRNIHPAIAKSLDGTFSDHEMAALSHLGTIAHIEAGQRFAAEGSIGREAVVVISGTADVVRNEEVIATVGSGTILGEISLLKGDPRNASLIAHDDVDIVVMSSREFRSLLDQCPRLADEVAQLIDARSNAS